MGKSSLRRSLAVMMTIVGAGLFASAGQADSHPPKTHGGHAAQPHSKPHPKPKPKHHIKHHKKHHKHKARGGHAKNLNHLQADGRADRHGDKNDHKRHHPKRTPREGEVLTSVRTLDGSGNNVAHKTWGQAGTPYPRVGPANYADGIASMRSGPPPRRIRRNHSQL